MNNQFDVDKDLLNKMYLAIRIEEGNNLKTGKYSDETMVKRIVQIIKIVLKEADNEI